MDEDGRFLDADGRTTTLKEALARDAEAVFRFLRKLSGDEERARDLAQDVMVKAILGFRKYRAEASFRTWLLAIAANLYRDSLRARRPLLLGEALEADDGGRAAEAMDRRLDAERAERRLAALPLKKRKALALRIEFGYSYEEIAAILGCPVGTVKSRIHEALETLRRDMGVHHG
jgi:RNA polymerase sigma-70 factor (ECF subfamily)